MVRACWVAVRCEKARRWRECNVLVRCGVNRAESQKRRNLAVEEPLLRQGAYLAASLLQGGKETVPSLVVASTVVLVAAMGVVASATAAASFASALALAAVRAFLKTRVVQPLLCGTNADATAVVFLLGTRDHVCRNRIRRFGPVGGHPLL